MLFIVNPQVVLMEVSHIFRSKIAHALQVPPSIIDVSWQKKDDGVHPCVDVKLPEETSVDEVVKHAGLPTLQEFFKAKGIDNPEKVIGHYVAAMMQELSSRLAALRT